VNLNQQLFEANLTVGALFQPIDFDQESLVVFKNIINLTPLGTRFVTCRVERLNI